MRTFLVLIALSLAACGGEEEARQCLSLDGADFDADSGWNGADYCDAPSVLGCYPFHESDADTCGPFTTMRTSATPADKADACDDLMKALNCGTFADGAGTSLTFHAASPDRFTMDVSGTYKGEDVDTVFYLNPCQDNCQAAITLDTIEPDQQKICEIPSQGKPVCMFPETAHSITFVRADAGSVILRMSGVETVLEKVADE